MTKKVTVMARLAVIGVFVLAAVIANSFSHYNNLLLDQRGARPDRQLGTVVMSPAVLVYHTACAAAKVGTISTRSLVTVYTHLDAATAPSRDVCERRTAMSEKAMFSAAGRDVSHQTLGEGASATTSDALHRAGHRVHDAPNRDSAASCKSIRSNGIQQRPRT